MKVFIITDKNKDYMMRDNRYWKMFPINFTKITHLKGVGVHATYENAEAQMNKFLEYQKLYNSAPEYKWLKALNDLLVKGLQITEIQVSTQVL